MTLISNLFILNNNKMEDYPLYFTLVPKVNLQKKYQSNASSRQWRGASKDRGIFTPILTSLCETRQIPVSQ
jgi:hypothetical protein